MSRTDSLESIRTGPQQRRRATAWMTYLAAEAPFLLAVTLGIAVISSVPLAVGYASAPADRWFSGLVYNVHDAAQYLSWMREAGRSLFTENMLTSEPNPPIYLNLHWWIPGRLGALAGLSLPTIMHLYRLLAIPLAVVALALLCRLVFADAARRRFALVLTVASSGLGWIWVVDKYVAGRSDIAFPLDVHGISGNVFWTMVTSPHLVLALALLFLTLAMSYVGSRAASLWPSLAAGGVALLLGIGHIYDLVTVWAVLAVFGIVSVLRSGWSTPLFLRLFMVVVVSSPSVAYWGWVSSAANPTWQQALRQYDNLMSFTPSPPHLLIFLGITFIVALPALLQRQASHVEGGIWTLLRCWFVTTLVLVYLPLPFQITLLAGYPLPMAALATVTLYDRVLPWLQRRHSERSLVRARARLRWERWLPVALLLVVMPTNLYLLAWRVIDLGRHEYPYYLHIDDVDAMRWLAANTAPQDVMLTSFAVGHYLPGLAGNKAYLANAVMTIDFGRKQENVATFFGERTDDAWRRRFLADSGVRYVLHGPSERALGGFDPRQSGLLEPCFIRPHTTVYRVQP
ncbi:MAG TPA: hypothetical protein GX714_01005 [Chloroflexi bacterium]|nr:hypothetical protein [Chloroflexota bacterium]